MLGNLPWELKHDRMGDENPNQGHDATGIYPCRVEKFTSILSTQYETYCTHIKNFIHSLYKLLLVVATENDFED